MEKKNIIYSEDTRAFCRDCLRPEVACFCNDIIPFDTKNRFTILMHPKEARRAQVGTGRLTHKALKNSIIIVEEGFNQNKQFLRELNNKNYTPILLYPGADSIDISNPTAICSARKPYNIFIIDGTWACAKKMIRLTTKLHSLPKLSFLTNKTSNFDIKQQPKSFCLSTIESVHEVLIHLENRGLENKLETKATMLKALKNLVKYHQECAADPSRSHHAKPSRPYQDVTERKVKRVKYLKRNIIFRNQA